MTKEEIKTIDLLGGLPEDNDLKALQKIHGMLVEYARMKNKKKEYFANNTILARCFSICCKCKALKMSGCFKLVPFSFVAALSYHKDFDEDKQVTSFAVANSYLKNEIAERPDVQRILRGYGAVPQYGNNAFCANERQMDALHNILHTATSDEVYHYWRQVRNWDIRKPHVDWFEQEQPDCSEYLSLILNIKWDKKKQHTSSPLESGK